ncbi:hypothetical protein LTR08_000695 [Meristemomyces frigidus]|nr:hypothetical protein LTR08_000695 [Meristemomyces frigidus]
MNGTETAVEASSLSTITTIGASPPPHPGIPIESIGAPLVLYIARVPGSRDVFLTPMKPRDKVVSAEDVQSSLYYVHVACEEDFTVHEQAPSPNSANSESTPATPTDKTSVRRKPVLSTRPPPPVSPPYLQSDRLPDYSPRPPSPLKQHQIARKPVNSDDNSNEGPPPPPHLDLPEIPKRALPTPPAEQPHRNSFFAETTRSSESLEDNRPSQRRLSSRGTDIEEASDKHKSEIGTLTLIRRNPASSEQWNVACIHDPPVHEVSSTALLNPSSARRTKKNGAPLYLDITNPGYGQFIDRERPQSRASTSTQSSDGEPPPEGTFRRRLYMPGSHHAEHGYVHRKLGSMDPGSSGDMRRTLRDPVSSDRHSSSPTWDKRSKSYSFTSPWEGKCEFSTGATGKSLKCRHTLAQQSTTDVSELRFNLPTSARNAPTPTAVKRSSYISRHSRHPSNDDARTPSIVFDENGRVDLSLGQEKAGGGLGGKQAKLGKLIVEPEGMKMLDLLVAANVGLWWRAYERA